MYVGDTNTRDITLVPTQFQGILEYRNDTCTDTRDNELGIYGTCTYTSDSKVGIYDTCM